MKETKNGDKILSVRLPLQIYQKLKEISEQETRTLNQQILHFVKLGLRDLKEEIPTAEDEKTLI